MRHVAYRWTMQSCISKYQTSNKLQAYTSLNVSITVINIEDESGPILHSSPTVWWLIYIISLVQLQCKCGSSFHLSFSSFHHIFIQTSFPWSCLCHHFPKYIVLELNIFNPAPSPSLDWLERDYLCLCHSSVFFLHFTTPVSPETGHFHSVFSIFQD